MGHTSAVQKYIDHMATYKWWDVVQDEMKGQEMADFDITRWRSFAERYLVERAAAFEPGKEMEGIWTEVNNALSAYEHIYHVGVANTGKPMGAPDVPAMPEEQTLAALAAVHAPKREPWYRGLVSRFAKVHA